MNSVRKLVDEHARLWRKRAADKATCMRIIELERLVAKAKSKSPKEVGLKRQIAARIGHDDSDAVAILDSAVRDSLRLMKQAA